MYETIVDELKAQAYHIGRDVGIAGEYLSTAFRRQGSDRNHFKNPQGREYAGWPHAGLHEATNARNAYRTADCVRLLAAQDWITVDGLKKQEHVRLSDAVENFRIGDSIGIGTLSEVSIASRVICE